MESAPYVRSMTVALGAVARPTLPVDAFGRPDISPVEVWATGYTTLLIHGDSESPADPGFTLPATSPQRIPINAGGNRLPRMSGTGTATLLILGTRLSPVPKTP